MLAQPSSIYWVYMDHADEEHVKQGELISADAGGLPIYRVMSLAHGRVWLRDVRDGSDRVGLLDRFHWKATPAQ